MNALNRRQWLKLTGAAAAGLPFVSHAAPDLRAKARNNLTLDDVPRARDYVLNQFEKI